MKERIRRESLKRRNRLSREEIERKSLLIRRGILKLPEFVKAKRILTYFEKGTEVKISPLITHMLNTGKEVILPITVPEKKELLLSRIMSLEELGEGIFGILEPKVMRLVPPETIELAILPGVAFDLEGNRIGYGGGYFDGLLHKMDALLIGVAYEIQIVEDLPSSSKDVRMDKIITESRVIEF